MESLLIAETDLTPRIDFDVNTGIFILKGKAITNDADVFFQPILNWLGDYINNPCIKTEIRIQLDYFNISSSKRLLFLFYKLNELAETGKDISIKWFYHEDEDDMYEVGQDFAFMVKIPFEFIEYSYIKELAF